MNRRTFVCNGAAAGALLPRVLGAQPSARVYRLGYIGLASPPGGYSGRPADPQWDAFHDEISSLGYVEGQNLVIERRGIDGRKLVESRATERNRLLKLLETANIKLASVVTDVFGVSGRLMLRALVEGRATPAEMAQLARGLLRKKVDDLQLALEGRLEEHHRFLLTLQLRRLDQLDSDVELLDARIDEALSPYEEQRHLLEQIPGISHVLAAVLLAELGTDMRVFPSARHVAAWAGVCPGNNESAGKQKTTSARKGNAHLRTALVEAAIASSRKKGSYCGPKRAAMAIAHKILIAAYHMLSTGASYKDLGASYLDGLDTRRVTRNLVRRLERLGYDVKLQVKPA
jgi:transposase